MDTTNSKKKNFKHVLKEKKGQQVNEINPIELS